MSGKKTAYQAQDKFNAQSQELQKFLDDAKNVGYSSCNDGSNIIEEGYQQYQLKNSKSHVLEANVVESNILYNESFGGNSNGPQLQQSIAQRIEVISFYNKKGN